MYYAALEASLGLKASVVCIHEPFLGNRSLAHAGFNLYWPSGTDNRKDMRVLIAVRKDIFCDDPQPRSLFLALEISP